jgi:hypothetical protein
MPSMRSVPTTKSIGHFTDFFTPAEGGPALR